MKQKVLIISLCAAVAVLAAGVVFLVSKGQKNIVTVNMMHLVDSFAYKHELQKELDGQKSRFVASLDSLEDQIRTMYMEIEASKATGKQRDEMARAYNEKTQLYDARKKNLESKISESVSYYNGLMYERLNTYINEYMSSKGIDIVYGLQPNGTIYATKALDVTAELIIFVNKKYEDKK